MMSISFTERPLFTKQLFCNSGNFTVKFVIVNFFLLKKNNCRLVKGTAVVL